LEATASKHFVKTCLSLHLCALTEIQQHALQDLLGTANSLEEGRRVLAAGTSYGSRELCMM